MKICNSLVVNILCLYTSMLVLIKTDMDTIVAHQSFNAIQLHLLKMFSFTKTEEGLQELQSVLFDYYRKKAKIQTDEFWQANHLNAAKVDQPYYNHTFEIS